MNDDDARRVIPVLVCLLSLAYPCGSTVHASDAVWLLSFKREADRGKKLVYEGKDYCEWQGVKCGQGRVVSFVVQSMGLTGPFPPHTLTNLDQLRVLSLRNNSLFGPIPDLSPLTNLKSLFLDHNYFSSSLPSSLLLLHRLLTLSLSHNNLSGHLPSNLTLLQRLIVLRLHYNHFSGTLPPLNQTSLKLINVSHNNLTGPLPLTLSRFNASSFAANPGLCGHILHKHCHSTSHFFAPINQPEPQPGPTKTNHHQHTGQLVLTFLIALLLIAAFTLSLLSFLRRRQTSKAKEVLLETPQVEPEVAHRSGKLMFCCGEVQQYTLEMLMRASAELLGRGSVGTTYKAVLDSRLILTVKRLDAAKTAASDGELFHRHMDLVGALRHPNLVPFRAYFQAKGERLLIYDYQPNGSLFNLLHGSRSSRAKPLHWTSCLKIAEDVAHGLAYIHQVSSLIHGNLKSSNVLLAVDFQACITDYCLALFADSTFSEDHDSAAYKAPEARSSSRRATSKSDVYTFGVLLIELLTGKNPSQHPFLAPRDLQDWVRAMRDDDGSEDNKLEMLTEVASICSATSPEQRPPMWQVLKMIQGIKDSVSMEDNALS